MTEKTRVNGIIIKFNNPTSQNLRFNAEKKRRKKRRKAKNFNSLEKKHSSKCRYNPNREKEASRQVFVV